MDKNRELEEKTERVVHMLAEENLSGVLIGSQHNFAWLTCGGSNGIDLSRDTGAGALFVRGDGRRYVIANNIEMPRLLSEELSEQDYEPLELSWEEEKANPSLVAERVLSVLTNGATLGSDLPVGNVARVVEGALTRTRYRLTEAEVERYRALGIDAGEAIGELARSLEPGLTETEIARRANDALAARGARSVVTLVAADERLAKFRHPVPTNSKWEKVVMVVVCARRAGLIVSLTRIVCAGPVPDELRRRTEATARVNAQLFAATTPGATGRELYEVVARAYKNEGFPDEQHLHHQGGACGYRTREWVAHPQSAEVVQPVQAFAWNPSITGTKVEETCIATAGGIEVITTSPDWPQITAQVEGREYLLPGALSL
jgi:antitoxin VapB